ncbi:hypothetical protein B0A80_20030 [Flavobacterium tructae]|uniref:hypothetical protein n=1 Tax=Flavobacterium tructae TaxID=1114873 RepID=UPI000B5BFED7|nr:hypothetical protein [Flavobacterium tructae]OXB19070.1 hypothetical protein B0A80_20030 [Flavobacterium tructae]
MKKLLFFFLIFSNQINFAQTTNIFPTDDNVGIGTTNPFSKLTISGELSSLTSQVSILNTQGGHAIIRAGINGITNQGMTFLLADSNGSNQQNIMVFSAYGNIGIGTVNPSNKLDVNGAIHSKEVKVDMNGWSDFVFKKEYNLPTLKETENYINKNGHLENIPSEKDVIENGLNLGEINAKLLQKIEELTLHLIQQNKKINDLEERLQKVEKN